MGLSQLISGIERTDPLVGFGKLAKFSEEICREIESIRQCCEQLWGRRFSIFLTGSLALCLRSGIRAEFRETGDPSDVDLWIFIDTNQPSKSPPGRGRCGALYSSYRLLDRFDAVSVYWPWSNIKFSVKLFNASAAHRASTLRMCTLRVLRFDSLRKVKKIDHHFGLTSTRTTRILEEKIASGYLWRWRSAPFGPSDIYLTDLLSCLLIGNFLVDGLLLSKLRGELRVRFYRAVDDLLPEAKVGSRIGIGNLLKYYYSRFPRSALEIFGKK